MRWLHFCVGVCLAFQAWAGSDWPPIPAEVWAIKEGAKGAVVLEERLRFQMGEIETVYRVRIFSEEGRAAAAISDLPKNTLGIKGRTVYPDGREVVFDGRKDFAERQAETGGRNFAKVHLVAPGVTSDCVVEIQWREVCDGYRKALPKRFTNGLYGVWTLGNPYPTRISSIEVAKNFPLAFFLTGRVGRAEDSERNGFRVLTYRNLPAMEPTPYALAPTNGFPRLVAYWQPDDLIRAHQDGRDAYWSEAFERIYKADYEGSVDTGGAFKRLAAELIAGLPELPQARARELLTRLQARIKNVSSPTAAEKVSLAKDFWGDYEYKRLDKAAASGLASNSGMRLMYYHLLKKAGIQPKIGKLVDREQALFTYGHLNAWQFNHDILGIEELGKADLWIDATNRYAAPGVIHPDYEGVPMLVYATPNGKTWKPALSSLPATKLGRNTRSYTYDLRLGEDADVFSVRAQFGGYPEYAERYQYLPQDAANQSRMLRDKFEKLGKNLSITKAVVLDATNPAKPVSWEVEGSLERENGRRREVVPFPGMTWPLWVPDKMDVPRSMPIILPYLATQTAVSSFVVPEGYRFDPHTELTQRNQFGSVSWSTAYDPQTRKVTVRFSVEVATLQEGSGAWSAFRDYLGWIQDACTRQVVLAREG